MFLFVSGHVTSWSARELVRGLAALVLLAPPTFWMGTTFPLLLQGVVPDAQLQGALGFGYLPDLDVDASRDPSDRLIPASRNTDYTTLGG